MAFAGTPGPHNAITDVPGVLVGYATMIEGDGALVVGQGPVRTGVTAILPRGRQNEMMPIWAGQYALNGNGEMTGTHWIKDGGYFLGPVCLTNSHSVGMVHHATSKWMIEQYSRQFIDDHHWAMPVIAETYDGVLNDINGQHVGEEHVFAALNSATGGAVAEGNVGGGTGMICYEFKGGTGTSSRRLTINGQIYTIGTLVQANHGLRDWLTILGVPVGKQMHDNLLMSEEQGSIIVVVGTDAPLLPHQLTRVAKRAAIGIGRGGTPGGNNSGDIFLAFSVANPQPVMPQAKAIMQMNVLNDENFDPIYAATVDTVDEAVINALVAAEDMTTLKPAGKLCKAIDHDELKRLMAVG